MGDREKIVKDRYENGDPRAPDLVPEARRELPRREFIRNAAGAAAAFLIVPRHVLGGVGYVAPSDKVNLAGIGVGGVGRSNLAALSSQNLVAMCDIDWSYVDARYGQIPEEITQMSRRLEDESESAEQKKLVRTQIANLRRLQEKAPLAARYTDYREMLEKQKDIDAVVIATPDHTHANIALAAMDLDKHVYLQKPLAWSVEECRRLARRAAETKVITQMGNQGRSSDDARLVNEYIAAGAIGTVTEVHAWTNRPLAYWPQGIPRPAASSVPMEDLAWDMNSVMQRLGAAMGSYSKPDALRWDLFLGPAPHVDYHPIYHPFNWRGWVDWGVGAIGDMGAHLIDHAWWALDLGHPTSVETHSTPYNRQSYPMSTITYYEFPGKDSRPPVKLTWYDGGLLPPSPDELGNAELNRGGGVLYVGSKGKLLHDTYGTNPRLLPRSLHESTGKPRERYERIATSHEMNWIETIRGNASATSPFEQGGPITEVMLLGVAALNAGHKIQYDAHNMQITNVSDSDALLKRRYRKGWELS
jgi:predicted dehydrogenase